MTEAEVRAFLAQFDAARRDFDDWPKWMQDAARTAAATFPCTAGVGAPTEPYWLIDADGRYYRNPKHPSNAGVGAGESNGKRSTSAATASGHELPDDTAAAAASLSVANGGDARAASAGCPESGKHCNVIDGECQTCGACGVKGPEHG